MNKQKTPVKVFSGQILYAEQKDCVATSLLRSAIQYSTVLRLPRVQCTLSEEGVKGYAQPHAGLYYYE